MRGDDVIVAVMQRIQDDEFNSHILSLINEAIAYISGQVDLPSLMTSSDVDVLSTESSVDLPTDYHKRLFWVGAENQSRRIGTREADYYNLHRFLENYYPVRVAQIDSVCVSGTSLMYHGSDTDTLTLRYYKGFTPITETGKTITVLPPHLHYGLLVNYPCREISALIESGAEGRKPRTMFYDSRFNMAMAELREWVRKHTPVEPVYVRNKE